MVITSKTQQNKITEIKHGLSPKSSFFIAIKIGSVIWEDAHIINMNWSKREHQEANIIFFKSNPLPMKNNLVEKRVNEAQSG